MADSNQARAYKAKRRGIKLTRETALAREKRIFSFSTSCVASKLAAKQAQLPQLCTFYPARYRGHQDPRAHYQLTQVRLHTAV